ncbi:hypothetical protein LINPERPRIM_LOCUS17486 [Linum perenne]
MSGPQCCDNPPTLNPSSGSGHLEKLGGLDSYVTGSPDSKSAVILISDVYGTIIPFSAFTPITYAPFWNFAVY